MKKLLLILLCLPMVVLAQQTYVSDDNYKKEDNLIKSQNRLKALAPKTTLNLPTMTNKELVNKSAIMRFPYPVIFIHGLRGNSSSWSPFTTDLYQLGWSYGGELEFCLEMIDITYVQDYCSLSDVQSFIPTNLPAADYYKIQFDCSTNGICNNSSSTPHSLSSCAGCYINSNQAAIVKQGYALGIAIEKVLNATGKEKVILMGHSMGGLAAREYIQNSYNWQSTTHNVAKLITSGTPHGGSNSTSFGLGALNFDEKSEAVRDLRTFYAIPPFYDGAYLYGNILEDDSYIQNNIVFTYHNVDVNCDGDENDYITGLNTKSWYTNIDYACIISDWLGNGSDGVVTTYSQDLTNFNGLPKLEKFDASSYEHTDLPSANYINFKSLDEPDYKELAYEIDIGSAYTGYLTYQGDYVIDRDYDLDYYRFSVNQSSYVQISVSNLPNNSYVSLLNSQNTIISQTGPNAFLSSFVSAGVYYLKIEGDAYGNPDFYIPSPWDNPYSFNISSSPLSIGEALFNKKSVLKITDMLGQETPYRRNTPLFYIYDDGTVEKRIVIE